MVFHTCWNVQIWTCMREKWWNFSMENRWYKWMRVCYIKCMLAKGQLNSKCWSDLIQMLKDQIYATRCILRLASLVWKFMEFIVCVCVCMKWFGENKWEWQKNIGRMNGWSEIHTLNIHALHWWWKLKCSNETRGQILKFKNLQPDIHTRTLARTHVLPSIQH